MTAKKVRTETPPPYWANNTNPRFTPKEQAILDEANAILDSKFASGETIVDPAASGNYLKLKLAAYPYEVFAAIFLDNRHRVLAFEELFRGTLDGSSVHPREVAQQCLRHNAAAIIVAHNHPSGHAEPSTADRAITQRLRDALELINVRLLDHIVVGAGTPVSLALRGWI